MLQEIDELINDETFIQLKEETLRFIAKCSLFQLPTSASSKTTRVSNSITSLMNAI